MNINNNLVSLYYENRVFKKEDENKYSFDELLNQKSEKSKSTYETAQENNQVKVNSNLYPTQTVETSSIDKSQISLADVLNTSQPNRETDNNKLLNKLLNGANEQLSQAIRKSVDNMREDKISETEITLQIDILELTLAVEYSQVHNTNITDVDLNQMDFSQIEKSEISSFLEEKSSYMKKYNPNKFNFFESILNNMERV